MDTDDDAVVHRLRALAASADPPPPELAQAARSALSWRRAERELAALTALAELSYDSADDDAALAGVRSGGGSRLLTFADGGVSVEVEVADSPGAGGLRLLGQLVPPQPGHIEARHADGVVTAEADDLGRFRCEGLANGPVSLRCHVGDGDTARLVVTDWTAL